MRLRGTNRNFRRVSPRVPFNPRKLFRNGEQGVHYDPSDLSTLFQDSAGTTPVTAVEQPVGLMLDKSKGLVLGAELVLDTQFNDATKWAFVQPTSGSVGVSSGVLSMQTNDGTYCQAAVFPFVPAVVHRSYQYEINVTAVSGGGLAVSIGGALSPAITSPGIYKGVLTASTTAALLVRRFTTTAMSCTVTSLSIRELPGNHAFQSTAIDRPILRNRYNLLTKTEQFDDAAWNKARTDVTPNAIVAPDGTLTAELLTRNSTTLTCSTQQSISAPIGSRITLRIRAKAAGVGGFFGLRLQGTHPDRADVLFNLSDGTFAAPASTNFTSVSVPPAIDLGSGWWELSITSTVANSALDRISFGPSAGGSVTTWEGASTTLSNAYIWGASLVQADQSHLPYQRVNTATDYDSDPSKFPLYLAANGTNTWMQTNSIDFTGTDKVTVFAGLRKLSDAATGMAVELSASAVAGNPGTLYIVGSSTTRVYQGRTAGTQFEVVNSAAYPAPHSSVLCLEGDIATDLMLFRVNTVQTSTSLDQGTGNFGNYPLYLFRRAGTTLPFNGNFYGLLIRGALTSDPDTLKMEKWLSFKTGVQL